MFYMDEGIDTGDVIAVERFPIEADDHAADVAAQGRRRDPAPAARPPRPDPRRHGAARAPGRSGSTYTRRRTRGRRGDRLDRPAHEIVRLIRALSPPYPLAHTFGGDGVPVLIEKARAAPELVLPAPRHHRYDPLRQRVLCVVAHPDDETLGVGGTLALHAEAGSEVKVLIMSEGEVEKLSDTPRCDTRRECALRAADAMGVSEVEFHDFPDQRLETVPFIELIKTVEKALDTFRPTVVYAHHGGDANTDHQVVFKAVYAACRPMTPLGSLVERFLTFETPSSTDQAPPMSNYAFVPRPSSTWSRSGTRSSRRSPATPRR